MSGVTRARAPGCRREAPASQDLIHTNNSPNFELAPWVYAFKVVRRAALRLYVLLLEHEALRRSRGADAR